MNTEKTSTAAEFFTKETGMYCNHNQDYILEIMKKFAEMHCKAQAQAIAEKADIYI